MLIFNIYFQCDLKLGEYHFGYQNIESNQKHICLYGDFRTAGKTMTVSKEEINHNTLP